MTDHRDGMGSIVHDGGVAFRVWAPNADTVSVVGDFNQWNPEADPLVREGDGYWYVNVGHAGPGHEYQYLVGNGDESMHRVDPYARQVTNSVGNGIVVDPDAFDWEGDEPSCPPHHQLVVYETHVGSFVGGHDVSGNLDLAVDKLGYLRDLGVNAIELMPVMEFAGDTSWGYNPAHVFAVESAYGGPDALKAFVKAAHQHGIAVVLDVVYNHFGPSDLDLWRFDGWGEDGKGGIYFYNDHRSATPWGDTRPDYGREAVRRFVRDNALMWLREYHVDGLRFDMTAYIRTVDGAGDELPDGWDLLRWITHDIRNEFPGRILVAEDLRDEPAMTGTGDGRAGFHSQWDSRFVHPVREALTAVDDDHRSMPEVAAAILGGGSDDAFARVVYTESHDEVANGKSRLPEEIDGVDPSGWHAQKRATLGLGLVLTSPGIPMLFQGQEFLEDEWFRDDVPLDWPRQEQFRDVVRMVANLAWLRRNSGGDSGGLTGHRTELLAVHDNAKVLAWVRSTDDPADDVVVAANFRVDAVEDHRIGMPAAGTWRLRFNGDAQTYSALFGGHDPGDLEAVEGEHDGHPAHAQLSLGPSSLAIWTR